MASPPYNPNEAAPGNTDVVANFPAAERTFRDIMESWMLEEHGRSGHHTFPSLTTAERDAITDWEVGSLIWNETTLRFEIAAPADPDTWTGTGHLQAPSGTRMFFQQTSAPSGWTKVTDSSYNDIALRLVTGSVTGPTGTSPFSTVFGLQATGDTTLTVAQMPVHNHAYSGGCNSEDNNNSGTTGNVKSPLRENHASGVGTFNTEEPGTLDTIEDAGEGEAHSHPIELRVKYLDVILAQKD